MRVTAIQSIRQTVATEGLTSVSPSTTATHLAVSWLGYAALAAVGFWADHLAVWIPCWFVMGWLLLGNGAFVHEALHDHGFRSTLANRLLGMAAGVTLLLPFATYRAYHLDHHVNTATPDDPEGEPITFTSRLQYFVLVPLGGPLFVLTLAWFSLRTLAGRAPRWVRTSSQRRWIVANVAVLAVAVAGLVLAIGAAPEAVVKAWLVPYVLTMTVLFPFVLLPEHYRGAGGVPPLENTRTTRSNAAVRWLLWNANFHGEHHLVAAVPHDKLERLNEIVAPQHDEQWKSSGYLGFHRDLLAGIPTLPRRKS